MSYTVRRHSKHNVTSKKRKSLVVDDEPPIQELPVLRRKRTLVLNRLRKTLEVAQKAKEDASQIHSFLAHYSVVSKLCDTFEQVHSDILCLVDGESEDKEDIIRAEFDEIYFTVATIHRQLIPCNAELSVPSPTVPDRSCISNVKLPKIKIPTFSGLIKSWPEFYDIFNSLVHNNELLSDTERMHYLVSCLDGEALGLIRTYPVQGTFYREAYDTLVARYRDKRELAFTCWKEILNINFKSNSPYEFRGVLDLMRENLNILRGLGLPTDNWDFVLCYLILSKLDSKTRCAYEQNHTNTELPQFNELLSFLYTKCEALVRDTHFSAQERPKGSTPIRVQGKSQAVAKLNNKSFKSKTSVFFSNTNQSNRSSDNSNNSHSCSAPKTPNYSNVKCAFCSDIHSVNLCKRFAQTPVTERIAFAKLYRWCFNCLRPSHTVKDCKSIFRCQKCRHRHHTLLHCDSTENTTTPSIQPTVSSHSNDQVQVLTSLGNNSVVLLSTANVQIRDSSGNFQTVRALIDCGSQAHFITERAARSLGFEFTPTSRHVSGLGNSSSVVSGTIKIEIGARGNSLFTVDALTLPSICGKMPSSRLDISTWYHLQHLTLADPDCHKPGPVDLLLGAEVFASLLLPGSVAGGPRQPSALNSVFGWLLLGTASGKEDLQSFFIKVDDSLNKEDKHLWELDSITSSSSDLLTPDEERCEAIYATQLSRDLEGRNRIERTSSKRWRGSIRRVVAASVYNLSCFTHGCSTGWVSGVLGTEALTGGAWLAALPCLVALPAAPMFAVLADARGRKAGALCIGLSFIISWSLAAWCGARGVWAARAVAGAGGAGALVLAPLYCAEIAPRTRGLAAMPSLACSCGILFAYAAGGLLSAHALSLSMAVPPAVLLLSLLWLPETPSFLINVGKIQEAAKIMCWFDGSDFREDLTDVIEQQEVRIRTSECYGRREVMRRQNSDTFQPMLKRSSGLESNSDKKGETSACRELFRHRRSRRALLSCVILVSAAAGSGAGAVTSFATAVLRHSSHAVPMLNLTAYNFTIYNGTAPRSFFESSEAGSMLCGTALVLGAAVATVTVDKLGRKTLLLWSCSGIAFCLAILGVYCDPHLRMQSWYSHRFWPYRRMNFKEKNLREKLAYFPQENFTQEFYNESLEKFENDTKPWYRIGLDENITESVEGELPVKFDQMKELTEDQIWLPVALLSMVLFLYNIGLGSVPYVLVSELFTINVRGLASSFILTWTWLSNFLVLRYFGSIAVLLGLHATYYICAACTLLAAGYVYLRIPETKNKSQSQIDEALERPLILKKQRPEGDR